MDERQILVKRYEVSKISRFIVDVAIVFDGYSDPLSLGDKKEVS